MMAAHDTYFTIGKEGYTVDELGEYIEKLK